jgi:hypothetical protein
VVGVDADGDGQRNADDLDDAALGAAVYLCAYDGSVSTARGEHDAIYRYNHSESYVAMVTRLELAYRTGDFSVTGDDNSGTVTLLARELPDDVLALGPVSQSAGSAHPSTGHAAHGTPPTATDPTPATPTPTPTPTPSEPTPTEPTPSEPAPSEPAPSEPAPSEPAPSEPAPSEPAPSEPAPSEPAPSEPAPSEPAPSDPTPSEPAPSDPGPTQPATDPAPNDPPSLETVTGTLQHCPPPSVAWCVDGQGLDLGTEAQLSAQAGGDFDGDGTVETNAAELDGLAGAVIHLGVVPDTHPLAVRTINGLRYV